MQFYEHAPLAPLPGTTSAPRGIFVDRWGTLLVGPEEGGSKSPSELRFHEGVVDALFRAHRAGWFVYVIGNEEDVAFGRTSDEEWGATESRYLSQLEAHGVPVRRQYACLDHPEGVGAHQRDSVFHLPNTGIVFHAAHEDGIRVAESWILGDSTLELVCGWRAGVRIAGVRTGHGLSDGRFHVEPEFVADGLADAVLGVLGQRPVELS